MVNVTDFIKKKNPVTSWPINLPNTVLGKTQSSPSLLQDLDQKTKIQAPSVTQFTRQSSTPSTIQPGTVQKGHTRTFDLLGQIAKRETPVQKKVSDFINPVRSAEKIQQDMQQSIMPSEITRIRAQEAEAAGAIKTGNDYAVVDPTGVVGFTKNVSSSVVKSLLKKGAVKNKALGAIEMYKGVLKDGKGFGLEKIASKHPEVLDVLEEAVKNGKVVEKRPNQDILEAVTKKGIVRMVVDHQLGTKSGIVSKTFLNNAYIKKLGQQGNVLRAGLEPATQGSSLPRSTTELPKHFDITKPVRHVNTLKDRVVQFIDSKTGKGSFYRIPKNQADDVIDLVDGNTGRRIEGVAGKIIRGQTPHVTAKTPKQMADRGFEDLGVITREQLVDKVKNIGKKTEFTKGKDGRFTGSRSLSRILSDQKGAAAFGKPIPPKDSRVYNQMGEAETRVLAEMEVAEAGARIIQESGEVVAKPSTFPKWVPEHLRSRKLFDQVVDMYEKGVKPKGSKQQELLDVVKKRIESLVPPDVADDIALNRLAQELENMPSMTMDYKSAIQRLGVALRRAKPARNAQEKLYSLERSKRSAQIASVGKKIPGEQGFFAQLGKLKGELPKKDFSELRPELNQADVDNLFNAIEDAGGLFPFEKISAKTGLMKLLDGQVPTKSEMRLMREVFPDELMRTIPDMRGWQQKAGEILGKAFNLPRSIMATLDLSAPLRQGVFMIGRPGHFSKSFGSMFKYALSEKSYAGLMDDIANRPTYKYMRQGRLSLTDLSENLTSREEQFMSNWAEKIPVFGTLARASNRAYTGFLNKLRADVFDDLFYKAKAAGIKNTSDEFLTSLGDFVSAATGRGKFGLAESLVIPKSAEKATPVLNALFFSPRLMAARLNMLNPYFYAQMDPFVRKEALKSLFAFAGIAGTTLGLASMNDGVTVSGDPRNADFGKIKIGNTRYDVLGGYQQYIRSAAQLITGEIVSSTTGRTMTVGEGYKPLTRKDIAQRFFEYKTSPVASFVIGLMEGTTAIGEDFDLPTEVMNRFVPFVIQDLYELAQEEGIEKVWMGLPAIFGTGVQTYGKQELEFGENVVGEETAQIRSPQSLTEKLRENIIGQLPLGSSKGFSVDAYYDQMQKMSEDERADIMEKIRQANPDLYKKIEQVIKDREEGITVHDKDLKAKGVASGDRAKAIVKDIEDAENKQALYEEYVKKNIITSDVDKQVRALLEKEGIDFTPKTYEDFQVDRARDRVFQTGVSEAVGEKIIYMDANGDVRTKTIRNAADAEKEIKETETKVRFEKDEEFRNDMKAVYDRVYSFRDQGGPGWSDEEKAQAEQYLGTLSDEQYEDYQVYKDWQSSWKAGNTSQTRDLLYPNPSEAVEYVRSLPEDEALRIIENLSDEEYIQYEKGKSETSQGEAFFYKTVADVVNTEASPAKRVVSFLGGLLRDFGEKKFKENVKTALYSAYPITPEAGERIDQLKVSDIRPVFGIAVDSEQEKRGFRGVFIPGSGKVDKSGMLTAAVISAFSNKPLDQIVEDQLPPDEIRLVNTSARVIAHEVIHAMIENNLRDDQNVGEVNRAWYRVLQGEAGTEAQQLAKEIDEHLDKNYQDKSAKSYAHERLAYFGSEFGIGGLENIPSILRPFYEDIFKESGKSHKSPQDVRNQFQTNTQTTAPLSTDILQELSLKSS